MNPTAGSRACLRGSLLLAGTVALLFGGTETLRAQDEAPVWKFRVGAGVLVSTGRDTRVDADHRLTLDRFAWPVVTIDAVRSLECCLEVFVSGLLPSIPTTITVKDQTTPASRLAPIGVQVGLNYRWRPEENLQFFAGPFLGAFTRDRTVGDPPNDEIGITLRETFGIGVNVGVSYVVRRRSLPDDDTPARKNRLITRDEWIVIDGGVRWQRANVLTGDVGRIGWNPVIITGGVTVHLW
jgi:hypothetical protein